MLTSIEGTYCDGRIELRESAALVPDGTPVIVTFMNPGGIDLRTKGINQTEAAELHEALATFEDWNDPEMDIYNDYEVAKSQL